MRRALVALAAALTAGGCGVPLMKLPSGPGVAAPDAADAFAQATSLCRAVKTLSAVVEVRGSAGGRHVSGRLAAGVAAPSSARIEAVAPFGAPVFIFVATGDEATLLLPRDGRVLEHGRPDAVLEAIAGFPLGAAELRATVTGCGAERPAALTAGRAIGDLWRVVPVGPLHDAYLHREREGAMWQLAADVRHADGGQRALRTEYRDFQNGLPRAIRVVGANAGALDLTLVLSQVDVNTPLDPSAFRVQIPPGAEPISLDELRRAGPFASRSAPVDGR